MSVKMAVQTVFSAIDHMTGPMAGMSKGVNRFASNARRASGGMSAGFGHLRSIVGTVATALATGAAAKAISDFGARADDVSDISRRLGLSTAAWQEFSYAAKAADMTSEDLTGVMQKMNNNLGQLKQGTGSLYTNLKKTNPQLALQLKHTTNTEQSFQALMDAIAGETDVQKRAALAQAAFGKSGQAIIDMAGDLNAKRAEARASGSLIDEKDVKAGQELHNTLLRLKASGQGFLNQVLGRVTSAIGPWLDRLDKWIRANRELIGQKIDRVINAVGRAFEFIAPFVKAAVDIFTFLKPVLPYVVAGIVALTVAQWALNVAMDANPVGAIILALTALVAIVIVVIRYWKEITTAMTTGWNKVNEIFNNPAVRIGLQMIAAPLAIILSMIQTIIDLVNGKGAAAFMNLLGPLKGISDLFGITKGGGKIPVSPNTGVIQSNTTTTARSSLDVNFNNAPQGTTMRQTGRAPGITVNPFNTLRAFN